MFRACRRWFRVLASTAIVALVASDAAAAETTWASDSRSPRPGKVSVADADLAALCGGGVDASLVVVARELAEILATKGQLPEAQEIDWRQRRAGSPHPWPRTWGARAGKLDRKSLVADVTKWLGGGRTRARCGVGSVQSAGREAIAVVAVEPIADLSPLPTTAKVGAWIDLEATLLQGVVGGRIVVLPPTGAPLTILSNAAASTAGTKLRGRFHLGRAGRYVVQVLASDGAGPRPVLEAEVWAGIDPPKIAPTSAVPGEEAGDGAAEPALALLARMNGARTAEGIPVLGRDPLLDRVATAHARAMRAAKQLGHDVGQGDPAARVAQAGGKFKIVGENVAKARSERAAHRAIHASPSHRGNLLDPRFSKVGIAVELDETTGELWVAQIFAG
jgi:uncharacterized protein YkwD